MFMHPQEALLVARHQHETPVIYADEAIRVEMPANNRFRAIRRRLLNRKDRTNQVK